MYGSLYVITFASGDELIHLGVGDHAHHTLAAMGLKHGRSFMSAMQYLQQHYVTMGNGNLIILLTNAI